MERRLMKCFSHPDGDAAAQCKSCSRGLCHSCAQRFSLMMCEGCILQHNGSVARSMYVRLIGTGILFVLLSWLFLTMKPPTLEQGQYFTFAVSRLLIALIFAFALWGWDFLDRHTRHLVSASLPVWVFYFLFKFMLSIVIGIIVGPYQIYRMVKEIRTARQTANGIANGAI